MRWVQTKNKGWEGGPERLHGSRWIRRECLVTDMPTSPISVSQGPFLGFQSVELLQTPPEGSADPGLASGAGPRPRRS